MHLASNVVEIRDARCSEASLNCPSKRAAWTNCTGTYQVRRWLFRNPIQPVAHLRGHAKGYGRGNRSRPGTTKAEYEQAASFEFEPLR